MQIGKGDERSYDLRRGKLYWAFRSQNSQEGWRVTREGRRSDIKRRWWLCWTRGRVACNTLSVGVSLPFLRTKDLLDQAIGTWRGWHSLDECS